MNVSDDVTVEQWSELDEAEVVVRAKAGSVDAFGELVRRHQARLRGFAARYLSNPDDVFDLVQDAFIDAMRAMDRFDESRPLGPWLRAICRNRILKHFRSSKVRKATSLAVIDEAIADRLEQETDAEAEAQEEWIAALKLCAEELSAEHRALVDARYRLGRAVKDLAAEQGLSPTAVSMKMNRIKQKLKACVERRLAT